MPESAWVAMTQLNCFPTEGEVIDTALLTHNSTSKADAQMWHCHLGHLNENAVLCMVKWVMVQGMEIIAGDS